MAKGSCHRSTVNEKRPRAIARAFNSIHVLSLTVAEFGPIQGCNDLGGIFRTASRLRRLPLRA